MSSAPDGTAPVAPLYLGVDIAGASNTWIAAITPAGDGAQVVLAPRTASLREIVDFATSEHVLGVAIDAQLTLGIADENGFRASDRELRALLPPDCRTWVASANSLMAVPVRGMLLAEVLAPYVGTILETHPRACLGLSLGECVAAELRSYKKGDRARSALAMLWQRWAVFAGVAWEPEPATNGALDALVCATVAMLYHRAPECLHRLATDSHGQRGRGPFYVTAPLFPSGPDGVSERI